MPCKNFKVTVTSIEQLLPEAHTSQPSTTTSLSIVDANVANWAPSSAVWYLEPPCSSLTPHHLRKSLLATLSAYPQWCGHVSVNPFNPKSYGHAHRYGRLRISYRNPDDPGAGFVLATCSTSLATLIPSATERIEGHAMWHRDCVPSTSFLPKEPPLVQPIHDPPESRNLGIVIQITQFSCGGLAIAVKMAHCLADAHALVYFVKDWAAISRAMLDNRSLPALSPVFEPGLVDAAAAGDIDAPSPATVVLEKSYALPSRGYDYWSSRTDSAWPVTIPKPFAFDNKVIEKPTGLPIPWATLNFDAPCSHTVIHFSPNQLEHIHVAASIAQDQARKVSISRHDALLAHIWICIARARREPISAAAATQNGSGDPFYIYLTLGMRPKQRLGLGENFLGSPIFHTAISVPAATLAADDIDDSTKSASPLSTVAARMREAVSRFTPDAIGAFLHRIAFEKTPQRIWHAFLGSRHTIVTSWVWAGVHDVDFCGPREGRLRYAEGVMPLMDGIVQVIEGTPVRNETNKGEFRADGEEARRWWDNGVDISISLETEAMGRLLRDAKLLPH